MDRPIRAERRRVKIISDGRAYNTRIVDAETGEEITPIYHAIWEVDARDKLAKVHLDTYLAQAELEGDAEITCHDTAVQAQHTASDRAAEAEAQLNAVYTERNQCIALIARMALVLGYTAGIGEDTECEEEWRNVVFIDLPNGQVSWHIPASERSFFDFLPPYEGKWDGHDTITKYDRVLNPGIYRTVTITVQIEGNVA